MTSSRQNQLIIAAALCAVTIVAGVYYWQTRRQEPLAVRDPDKPSAKPATDKEANAEYVVVGGVRRPASDLRPARKIETSKDPLDVHPGTVQPVPLDANPNVASVVEAIREKKHPERLSTTIAPAPFDPAAFRRDPQKYLNTVEPGRVFQTAQPGPNVPVLQSLVGRRLEVRQGESVKLRVQAVAGAPVTFTSFDLGAFQNQLTSITVTANPQGVAEAEFFGTPGTFSDVNILAGSPLTTGQVKFVVDVVVPQKGN